MAGRNDVALIELPEGTGGIVVQPVSSRTAVIVVDPRVPHPERLRWWLDYRATPMQRSLVLQRLTGRGVAVDHLVG